MDFPPNINNLSLVEAVKALILIWTNGTGTVPSGGDSAGVPVDRSGTIATGGQAQTVANVNANRRWLLFQNVSDTDMWVNFSAAAVAGQSSILLKANGGSYENPPQFCPTGLVSVMCATTGKAFVIKEG